MTGGLDPVMPRRHTGRSRRIAGGVTLRRSRSASYGGRSNLWLARRVPPGRAAGQNNGFTTTTAMTEGKAQVCADLQPLGAAFRCATTGSAHRRCKAKRRTWGAKCGAGTGRQETGSVPSEGLRRRERYAEPAARGEAVPQPAREGLIPALAGDWYGGGHLKGDFAVNAVVRRGDGRRGRCHGGTVTAAMRWPGESRAAASSASGRAASFGGPANDRRSLRGCLRCGAVSVG